MLTLGPKIGQTGASQRPAGQSQKSVFSQSERPKTGGYSAESRLKVTLKERLQARLTFNLTRKAFVFQREGWGERSDRVAKASAPMGAVSRTRNSARLQPQTLAKRPSSSVATPIFCVSLIVSTRSGMSILIHCEHKGGHKRRMASGGIATSVRSHFCTIISFLSGGLVEET